MTLPDPDPAFLPGLDLSRTLYEEAVRPVLDAEYPGLRYAAARIGSGSEVLGFDTARSADHEWGPRLDLFLELTDAAAHGERLHRLLAERLPKQVRGWPTHFRHADPADPVGRMEPTDGPVHHRVLVADVGGWLHDRLGLRPGPGPGGEPPAPTVRDWLAMPQQKLAETTGGAVFHDGVGTLTRARQELHWYPGEVWRYLLACQWQRISQEEAFVGRCAEVGDELGSAVVAGRLVRDLMRLCLLLAREYAPYGKWLGSAFARLPGADELLPVLRGPSRPWTTRRANGTSATRTRPSPRCRTARASRRPWTPGGGRTTAARSRCCTPSASPRPWPGASPTRNCGPCR